MTPLEAALTYASWGWPVLMLQPNSKLPATAHGVKDATTDEATIRSWFAERPFANVGIAAGSASGLVVYDIDPRNGGADSWEAWQAEHGKVPDGAMQLTAGGGVHHLAAYVEGVRSTKLRDGIDLLSDGRYFVAFPSVVGGRQYTWELSSDPFDGVAPFTIPDSWRSVAPKTAPTRAGVSLLTGSRNDGLTALAGAMRHHGMSSDEILAALLVTNETRCDVPLPLSEVRQIAAGIGRYEPETDTAANGAMANEIAEGLIAGEEAKRNDLAARMRLLWASQIGDEYQPPDELIEGVMTLGSISVLYGDSNSGKTFLALSMAAAVASGSRWHGRQVDQGLVVYLATEAPGSIRARVQAIQRLTGVDLDDLAIVQVPLNFYQGPEDVTNVARLVALVEQQRGKRARLVIGDTLARMSAGANENSGEDMGPVMARFDWLAQSTGCAVLLVHHTGKDSAKGARGWSGIRAHIDTEIEVKESSGARVASITKQRELAGKGDEFPFRLEIVEMGTGKFGSISTTCVALPDDSPPPEKKKPDSPTTKFRRVFEDAVFASGMELRDNLPYVSRSALKAHLLAAMGWKESTAAQAIKPSSPGKLVFELLAAKIIEPHADGWRMLETDHAVAMRLRMRSK